MTDGSSPATENDVPMQDLRLEMRVKNNVLRRAIFSKHQSVAHFCASNESLHTKAGAVGQLLGFKLYPFLSDGEGGFTTEYRPVCLAIEKALGIPAEDLFPKHLYNRFYGEETVKVLEVSSFTALPQGDRRKILYLPAREELDLVENLSNKELVAEMLPELSYRKREILRLRFGIPDGHAYSAEEVGRIFKVTAERVRQIEMGAIRQLQEWFSDYGL